MLEVLTSIDPFEGLIYLLLFGAGVVAVQGAMGVAQMATKQQTINKRLQIKAQKGSVEDLIIELRQQRGLNADGSHRLFSTWFNRLVTRSGLRYEPAKWLLMSIGVSLIIAAIAFYFLKSILVSVAIVFVLSPILPVFALKTIGGGRAKKLAEQLPEALEVVVRSLEAGHPVPTAVSLVGAEMPDPIGSEFGMVSDEMAYGSALGDGILRLARRVEDEDIDLFAATVRLQEKTGGNLAELLKLNAQAVRGRQTMRLKIKAASAEGRASALILSLAPLVGIVMIHLMKPEFYGDVIHMPMVKYGLAGFFCWMMIGNFIMNRMIKFKI